MCTPGEPRRHSGASMCRGLPRWPFPAGCIWPWRGGRCLRTTRQMHDDRAPSLALCTGAVHAPVSACRERFSCCAPCRIVEVCGRQLMHKGRVVRKRKMQLLASLAVASLPILPQSAHADAPVTLGVVSWIGYGPIYCAAANGYYKRYGLDVKLITFTDNSVMAGAVQGGEIDATTMTYDQVIA